MGVVPAIILEDEADHREHQGERAHQEHPPADRHAHRGDGGGEPDEQGPPAMRAEEAELAGALLDLTFGVVLRPSRQPPTGVQDVEAGQEGKPDRERQRGAPGGVMRQLQ